MLCEGGLDVQSQKTEYCAAGGFIGEVEDGWSGALEIKNSYSNAAIKIVSGIRGIIKAGGFVGSRAAALGAGGGITFVDCYAAGTFDVNGPTSEYSSDYTRVGGFFGDAGSTHP